MNWYKKANLWDEIKRHGPKDSSLFPRHATFPYDEGEYEKLVKYLQNKSSISREDAEQQVQSMPEMIRRDYFVSNYGWSVPSEKPLEKLKTFIGNNTVLDVGSGYGLWARLLQNEGINVIATTLIPTEDKGHMPRENRSFTNVEDISHLEAIEKYPEANVLMMSWPPYEDPMAYEALKNFKGNKLIYVGEGGQGCTGCNDFHSLLDQKWKMVGEDSIDKNDFQTIDIPQWSGIHDSIFLYVRK